jgi:hypothetical protein
MDGRLPWFMFFMKGMMQTFIGMDYERGLRMVREYIETGTVLSKTEIIGTTAMEGREVMGVRASAPTDDVGPVMRNAFDVANAVFFYQIGAGNDQCVSSVRLKTGAIRIHGRLCR